MEKITRLSTQEKLLVYSKEIIEGVKCYLKDNSTYESSLYPPLLHLINYLLFNYCGNNPSKDDYRQELFIKAFYLINNDLDDEKLDKANDYLYTCLKHHLFSLLNKDKKSELLDPIDTYKETPDDTATTYGRDDLELLINYLSNDVNRNKISKCLLPYYDKTIQYMRDNKLNNDLFLNKYRNSIYRALVRAANPRLSPSRLQSLSESIKLFIYEYKKD